MQTIFYVKGYNSYDNQECSSVFKNKIEAERFCIGLTNGKIYMFKGKTIIDAVNHIF